MTWASAKVSTVSSVAGRTAKSTHLVVCNLRQCASESVRIRAWRREIGNGKTHLPIALGVLLAEEAEPVEALRVDLDLASVDAVKLEALVDAGLEDPDRALAVGAELDRAARRGVHDALAAVEARDRGRDKVVDRLAGRPARVSGRRGESWTWLRSGSESADQVVKTCERVLEVSARCSGASREQASRTWASSVNIERYCRAVPRQLVSSPEEARRLEKRTARQFLASRWHGQPSQISRTARRSSLSWSGPLKSLVVVGEETWAPNGVDMARLGSRGGEVREGEKGDRERHGGKVTRRRWVGRHESARRRMRMQAESSSRREVVVTQHSPAVARTVLLGEHKSTSTPGEALRDASFVSERGGQVAPVAPPHAPVSSSLSSR